MKLFSFWLDFILLLSVSIMLTRIDHVYIFQISQGKKERKEERNENGWRNNTSNRRRNRIKSEKW